MAPQLLKTSFKQVWCWPLITGLPPAFQWHHGESLIQQAITGLAIATIDASISTPLERAKILSAIRGIDHLSLQRIYQEGWRGFAVHWSKLSVNWVAFLVSQKYLREQAIKASHQPLSYFQLVEIGCQVAFIVSIVSAPFDRANTLKQAQDLNPLQLFRRKEIFKFYRGSPLNALSLCIHNVASVILIEKLGN